MDFEELTRLLNDEQREQIKLGLENGLTNDQVALYADPKFSQLQMEEIRQGLENGLTQEQVALYADTKFTWVQMAEIRRGLQTGLSVEQVKTYADPQLWWLHMREMRIKAARKKPKKPTQDQPKKNRDMER